MKNIVSVLRTTASYAHVLFPVIFSPMYWFQWYFHYQTSILSYTLPLFSETMWFFSTILHHHVLQWVDDLADAGADQYTFHLEATSMFNSPIPSSSTGVEWWVAAWWSWTQHCNWNWHLPPVLYKCRVSLTHARRIYSSVQRLRRTEAWGMNEEWQSVLLRVGDIHLLMCCSLEEALAAFT